MHAEICNFIPTDTNINSDAEMMLHSTVLIAHLAYVHVLVFTFFSDNNLVNEFNHGVLNASRLIKKIEFVLVKLERIEKNV